MRAIDRTIALIEERLRALSESVKTRIAQGALLGAAESDAMLTAYRFMHRQASLYRSAEDAAPVPRKPKARKPR